MAQSCLLIDDDLSVCPPNEKSYNLNYSVKLETNMNLELATTLSADVDQPVAQALRNKLSSVFTDHANDVQLKFFDEVTGNLRFDSLAVINSNRTSFAISLPREQYMHLSLANVNGNGVCEVYGGELSAAYHIQQRISDTLPSQQTGLFSARLPMDVVDTIDQDFHAILYMINSAVALVVDTAGYSGHVISAYTEGTASDFYIKDSIYLFQHPSIIRAEEVIVNNSNPMPAIAKGAKATHNTQACFTTVCMPSADTPNANGDYWAMKVYVRLPDGTITENVLSVSTPLLAGNIKVIKVKMQDDGSLVAVTTTNVGISVTLDWKQGSEYEPWLGLPDNR